MSASRPGTFRLFRILGIDVSLHWMWILVAAYEIQASNRRYTSIIWNVAEYLTLFLIVLLHEFGHALACRSVGGLSDHIMLWPLGGVAYVNPPPRAGALLWSIAAGPLVNVALLPVTIGAYLVARHSFAMLPPDFIRYLYMVAFINGGLLAFNMLPIYPLDGGQILRALLWFVVGRAKSLYAASVIGVIGAAVVIVLALIWQDVRLIVLAAFGGMRSLQGFKHASAISKLLALPRHETVHCPGCGNSPPAGLFWGCSCGAKFDTFASGAICPNCGKEFSVTACAHCGRKYPWSLWPGATEALSVSPLPQ